MHNIHLRGLDKQLIQKLKLTASQQNISLNSLIVNLIRQGVGLSHQRKITTYHDLDQLAGTWTSAEQKKFLNNIKDFEEIERDLWK